MLGHRRPEYLQHSIVCVLKPAIVLDPSQPDPD